jgi:hypothetical protein
LENQESGKLISPSHFKLQLQKCTVRSGRFLLNRGSDGTELFSQRAKWLADASGVSANKQFDGTGKEKASIVLEKPSKLIMISCRS